MERNRPMGGLVRNNSAQINKQTRFSIHDAFEEENDEAIRVYGSTVISNPNRPASIRSSNSNNPVSNLSTCDPRYTQLVSVVVCGKLY